AGRRTGAGGGRDGGPGGGAGGGAAAGDVLERTEVHGQSVAGEPGHEVAAPLVQVGEVRVLRERVRDPAAVAVAVAVAGDGGGDQFAGHHGRVGVVEVGLEVGQVVHVGVAGEDDRIGGAGHGVQDAGALGGVAVPGVQVDLPAGAGAVGAVGHHDLLAEQVPAGRGVAQPLLQPAPLAVAEQGAAG